MTDINTTVLTFPVVQSIFRNTIGREELSAPCPILLGLNCSYHFGFTKSFHFPKSLCKENNYYVKSNYFISYFQGWLPFHVVWYTTKQHFATALKLHIISYRILIHNPFFIFNLSFYMQKEGMSKLKFPFWNVIVWYYNNGKAIFTPCFQGKYGLSLACENNLLINCKLVNPKIEFWHSPFIL